MHPIPPHRLPDGFADRLDNACDPVQPRPAATVVLLRAPQEPGGHASQSGASPHADRDEGVAGSDGSGLEVLLLRRTRSAGFVPGAWVFPGGRVDAADHLPGGNDNPLAPALVAALREAFEETGILLARSVQGERRTLQAARDPSVDRARRDLLDGTLTLTDLLEERELTLDVRATAHIAHWITPEAEPRRYDTRFFAASVPAGTRAAVDNGEIMESRWIAPHRALADHEAGDLPMILPTVTTLEALREFRSPEAVVEYYRTAEVSPILPRFVRTPEGIALEVEATPPGRPDHSTGDTP